MFANEGHGLGVTVPALLAADVELHVEILLILDLDFPIDSILGSY
jgi:hypothetical protein